jgi:hypothetical protein
VAAFLVLFFEEEEVEVEAPNGLFEIPSTLSLKISPFIWDETGGEEKLVT